MTAKKARQREPRPEGPVQPDSPSETAEPESADEAGRNHVRLRDITLGLIVEWIVSGLVRAFRYVLVFDKKPSTNDDAPHAMMEAFTLIGFLIAAAAVLGASLQGDWTVDYRKPWIFLGVSVIPLVLMFVMLRLSRRLDGKASPEEHLFHPGTVTVLKSSLTAGVLLVALAAIGAVFGLWPTQDPGLPIEWEFPEENVEEYQWEFDGSPGILVKVPVVLDDIQSDVKRSGRFAVEVVLRPALSETWSVDLIDLYDEVAEERVDSVQVWATANSGYDDRRRAFTYFETAQVSEKSRIEVYLHYQNYQPDAEDHAKEARQSAISAIKEGLRKDAEKPKGLRFFYLPDPKRIQPAQ